MASLKEKTMRELIDLEIAARLICSKYENMAKIEGEFTQDINDQFQNAKSKYDKVLAEIEKRVNEI
jgi:hypothetical protein